MLADYKAFEKGIKIKKSPDLKGLVNFGDNLSAPYHRWYKFKEGFSFKLVEKIIDEFGVTSSDHLIDCFLGCGTSVLSCEQNQINSTGVEINPFLKFLSYVKTRHYSDPEDLKLSIENLISSTKKHGLNPPNLSTFDIAFDESTLKTLLDYKGEILMNGFSRDAKNFMLIGLGAILEDVSKVRKDGKALRIVRDKEPISINDLLSLKLSHMFGDVSNYPHDPDFVPEIHGKSATDLSFLKNDRYKMAIFSPPYLNTFDYLEVYKLELWMLDFIQNHEQRTKIREETVRSHLDVPLDSTNLYDNPFLESIIREIKKRGTWSYKIPLIIKCYFEDMYRVLDGVHDILENDGHCVIVVGNSSYANVPIPTDSILARIGEKVGFEIKEIRVARHIRRSSQQYTHIKKNGMKYLRESVIVLKK